MATMEVKVVSPSEQLFDGEATEVYARALEEGELGILPGHQPVVIALAAAPVRVKTADGREESFNISGGFLEYSDNHMTVLVNEVVESP